MVQLARAAEHTFPAWEGAGSTNLFKPIQLGASQLEHRIAYAPLTRLRNVPDTGVPTDLVVEHYAQRATPGGLLITEGTLVGPDAAVFSGIPGIYSEEQAQGWKRVTDAVHAKGGQIWIQLAAQGREKAAKPGQTIWSAGTIPLSTGSQDITPLPRFELERLRERYRAAARLAVKTAGFDGVELHGANGFLIDQFLQSVSNNRTDEYGGADVEKRIRFPAEVVRALVEEVGEERVGVRMSPFSPFQEMREERPLETFVPWARYLVETYPRLAYIHAVEPRISGGNDAEGAPDEEESLDPIRQVVREKGRGKVKFLVAGGYDPKSAAALADEHPDDTFVFGRYYIGTSMRWPSLARMGGNGDDLCSVAEFCPTFFLFSAFHRSLGTMQPTRTCPIASATDTRCASGTDRPSTSPAHPRVTSTNPHTSRKRSSDTSKLNSTRPPRIEAVGG
ncbi:hypothetical protein ACQY0O_008468 [Thecaphora frezii]